MERGQNLERQAMEIQTKTRGNSARSGHRKIIGESGRVFPPTEGNWWSSVQSSAPFGRRSFASAGSKMSYIPNLNIYVTVETPPSIYRHAC